MIRSELAQPGPRSDDVCPAPARIALAALASGVLVGATGLLAPDPPAVPVLLLVVLSWICVGVVQAESRRLPRLGLFNPSAVIFGLFGVLYVARPAYVLATEVIGTPAVGKTPLSSLGVDILSWRYLLLAVAIALFTVAYRAAPTASWEHRLPIRELRRGRGAVLAVAFAVSATCAVLVSQTYAQFGSGPWAALTVRHHALAGANYLIFGLTVFKLVVIVYVGLSLDSLARRGRRRIPRVLLALWFASVVFDLVSGERAELVVGNLFPFGGMLIAFKSSVTPDRRFKRRLGMIAIVLLGLLTFVGYRVAVRDTATRGTASIADVGRAVIDLPAFIFGSDEAAAFDYFVLVPDEVPDKLDFRGVETAESVVLALTPRELFESKPERSSVLLTERMAPEAYERGANAAFSAPVDLYFTAGAPGVLLGMAFVGWCIGWVVRGPTRSGSILGYGMAFVLASLVLPVLRSDLYAAGGLPVHLFILWLAWRLLGQREHGEMGRDSVRTATEHVRAIEGSAERRRRPAS